MKHIGVRYFCERQGKLPSRLSVGQALELTRGQYGHEEFAAFFQGKK